MRSACAMRASMDWGGCRIEVGFAMTSNFVLNSHFASRNQRLHGRAGFEALFTFHAVCSTGRWVMLAAPTGSASQPRGFSG